MDFNVTNTQHLVSLGCRQVEPVPKKLLFPCMRRFCGVPDPEESSDTTNKRLVHSDYTVELKVKMWN